MIERYLKDGSVEVIVRQFEFCGIFKTLEEGRAEFSKLIVRG